MKVYIIHGWEGYPEEGWFPWLKKELEKKGFKVEAPRMPNADKPKLDKWLLTLDNLIKEDNSILIGHSLGCRVIMKYLEKNKAFGAVFVAARMDKSFFKELEEFYKKPVNWNNVKNNCKNIIGIYSDNDPYVPIKDSGILKEKLNAKIVIEHNKHHIGGDSGIKQLPSVLKAVMDFVR